MVTSTATTITLGGTVTLGAGMDRLDLNTLGGNDSITLALAVTGLAKFIDAAQEMTPSTSPQWRWTRPTQPSSAAMAMTCSSAARTRT